MTRRLFVCHATADIEATSELIDSLENALNFGAGSLWTSGLPGYSAEPNDMPALGAALAGSDLVLALVTRTSVHDPQFYFQLGAAWALGAHTLLFLLDPSVQEHLPSTFSQATTMRGHEPSQWSELIGDLSVRLGLVPRPGASAASPSYPPGSLPAYKSAPPRAAAAVPVEVVEREPATVPKMPILRSPIAAVAAAMAVPSASPRAAKPAEPALSPIAAVAAATAVPGGAVAKAAELSAAPSAAAAEVPPEPAVNMDTDMDMDIDTDIDTDIDIDIDIDAKTTEVVTATEKAAEPATPPPAAAPVTTTADHKRPPALPPLPAAIATRPTGPAMPHSYMEELRAIAEPLQHSAERTPPRHSYIDDLREVDANDVDLAAHEAEIAPEQHEEEPETREQLRVPPRAEAGAADGQPAAESALNASASEPGHSSDSDVFARLPTCEMALEAGRAVSDCLFNRDEIENFAAELDAPLGHLIECLGASWNELRGEQDLDTWVAVTDHLLQTLPEDVRKVEEWYRVGFELATLHNLAGQLVLDGTDAGAEQHWRGALERFLMRAERAEIGYENLGRVLGLLENLAGPSHERDLSNIPRSLEELRRYAAGADIHTAA